MKKVLKIMIISIITFVIASSGIYFWKNSETPIDTSNWRTYSSNIGVSLKYPNEGAYSIDDTTKPLMSFTISGGTGNKFHIHKTNNLSAYSTNSKPKVINGKTYNLSYSTDTKTEGYRYSIEYNGQPYVFKNIWGPENKVFEKIMTTVEFE